MRSTHSTAVLLTCLGLLAAPAALGAGGMNTAGAALRADPGGDAEKERVIRPSDKLGISVDGLDAPNKVTTLKVVVDEKGQVRLPQWKEPIKTEGLTCGKLAQAVDKAYRDAKLIEQAGAKVVFAKESES
jgi:hypothetical protein